MCRYIVITHTYDGCKLIEVTQEGTPTPKPGLLTQLTNAITGHTPGENPPPAANDHGGHVITEKGIFQCSKAVDDATQRRIPAEKRKCANLKPLRESDGVPVNEAEIPLSKFQGVCPACQAGEDAIRNALSKETIHPVEKEVTLRPVSRGQGSRRGGRHVHHTAHGRETINRNPSRHKEGGCRCM